jgi:hypothetical protein
MDNLKLHVDNLSMRVYEAEAEKDDKVAYYKELVVGLQKTAANAEEASEYMRHMHCILISYAHGEKLEDLSYKSTRMCVVCMSEPAAVVAKPCHHLEWCRSCAITHFKLKDDAFAVLKSEFFFCDRKECPRCKVSVESIDYVFA